MRQLYFGFGLIISSEIELPCPMAGDGVPDVTIRLDRVETSTRVAGVHEEVRVFRDAAAFRIKGGKEITVDPSPDGDPIRIRLVLMGTVMAHLMRQRGWLSLHASGVMIGGRAVLLAGLSGAGKSTVAAAFHAAGHAVISDDVCPVQVQGGDCRVQPSWPRIRLSESSCGLLEGRSQGGEFELDKYSFSVKAPDVCQTIPVARIYILEFGEQIQASVVQPLTAVTLVSSNSFSVRRRMTREALDIHVRDCVAVAGVVRVYRLVRQKRLSGLPEMVKTIEQEMSSGSGRDR